MSDNNDAPASTSTTEEARLRSRIANHLCNVANLPEGVQAAALGADFTPLVSSLTAIASDYAAERVAQAKTEAERHRLAAIGFNNELHALRIQFVEIESRFRPATPSEEDR